MIIFNIIEGIIKENYNGMLFYIIFEKEDVERGIRMQRNKNINFLLIKVKIV